VAKLPKKNYVPPMLFYGKNLAQFFFMFGRQTFGEKEVHNEGVTSIQPDCYETLSNTLQN
jgi:hypothetical protein